MKKSLLLLLFSCMLLPAFSQNREYPADWSTLKERPYPQWFVDAKLGIFIHWTLSSVPAWSGKEQYGEWFLRGLMTGDTARIHFQERVFGANFKYEQYAPLFKAELFNAAEWAELFRQAGAKYIVFVSKHHDGFCLWPTKYSPGWNSMDIGPHRDFVGELDKEIRKAGLKMGLYYSLPEWNNSLYRWGTDKPEMVHKYVDDHMIPQFKELIGTYKPSLLFSDGEWDHPASTWHSAELISWYYNLVGDEAIVNDRWGSGSEGIGFRTPEYSSGLINSDRPWAEVRGLGRSFGLNRNEPLDAYMSPKDLVHFFVNAVANGGGMILNVGPYCDGQIPLLQQERLLQLGSWLKVNGEAIYASKPYKKTFEEKEVLLERIDPDLNFDWVRNSPGKPIAEDHFSAEWTGFLHAKVSDEFTIEAEADDAVRVWIDGKCILQQGTLELLNKLDDVDFPTDKELKATPILLKAGEKHSIRVEFLENIQNARLVLSWSSKKHGKEIIPADCFSFTGLQGEQSGLMAVYRSEATRLCYTTQGDIVYAIALEWPSDNILRLIIDKPEESSRVVLLGRQGELNWKYSDGQMQIDLNGVKITELPCDWAWVFKIYR